jgi:Family of unknown function (DUF6629)
MCFSATASFIAGGALSTIGVATVKKTKKKSELPFAAIPLLFAIQQMIEGILWLAFYYNQVWIQSVATFLFSLFAYALWPVFIPFSVRLLEPLPSRKKILTVLQTIGGVVGLYLLYFVVRYPITCSIVNYSIQYADSIPFGFQMFWLYIVSGCGSCFVSSHKIINLFGILLVLSIVFTYRFYEISFVSVWCFCAAILSAIVYLYFVKRDVTFKTYKISALFD